MFPERGGGLRRLSVMDMNLFDDDGWLPRTWPPERAGFEWQRKRFAGEHLGASLYALPPGQATFPYHYELGNDELLVVVAARHCCVQPKVSGRSSQAIAFFSQAERRALTK